MLGLGIIAPLMPVYAESLGATGIWLGIIFSAFSLSRAIFTPIIGRISDRSGRKKFIISGLLLYSIVSLLYSFAGNVYCLTGIRFIHGFASALVVPIAMAYIGETTEKGKEGSVMGIFSMALFLGMGAGPFLGGFLNDVLGLASAFYAMAGLTAIAFLIALLFLPDIRSSEEAKANKLIPFKKIIQNNVLKGLILFRIINAIGRGGLMSFLPIFASRINIASSQVGVLLSVNIFLTALLQKPFGRLADRYNRFYLLIIGSIIGTFALVLVPLSSNFRELFIISSIMGIGGAVALPPATAITVEIGQKIGMGIAMGIFSTAMSIGMVVAPLLSGVVMDVLGLESVFYVAAIVSFLGTLVFYHYIRAGSNPQ